MARPVHHLACSRFKFEEELCLKELRQLCWLS